MKNSRITTSKPIPVQEIKATTSKMIMISIFVLMNKPVRRSPIELLAIRKAAIPADVPAVATLAVAPVAATPADVLAVVTLVVVRAVANARIRILFTESKLVAQS